MFVVGLALLPHRLAACSGDFHAATSISVVPVISVEPVLVGIMVAAVFVTRSEFFGAD